MREEVGPQLEQRLDSGCEDLGPIHVRDFAPEECVVDWRE